LPLLRVSEKYAIRVELTGGCQHLLCGISLAHDGIANDIAITRDLAGGFERLAGEFDCAGRVVIRHANGVTAMASLAARTCNKIRRAPVPTAC